MNSKLVANTRQGWERAGLRVESAGMVRLVGGETLAIVLRGREPRTGNVTVLTERGQVRQYLRRELAA